jgi:hypothetical protein
LGDIIVIVINVIGKGGGILLVVGVKESEEQRGVVLHAGD